MKISTFFLIAFISFSVFSCKKPEIVEMDRNQELFAKYDGLYLLTSAYLDAPYDLNNDGVMDENLLLEIPEIKDSDLEIFISKQNRFLIIQWVEQYLASGNSDSPDFIYVKQGPHLPFDLNEDETKFIYGKLDSSKFREDKIARFASPISLTMEDAKTIKAVISKTFYTQEGLQDLTVTATFSKKKDEIRKGYK